MNAKSLFFTAVALMFVLTGIAQGVIKGRIIDLTTRKPILSANILLTESLNGASTDFNGEFLIRTKEGDNTLEVSSLGYASRYIDISGHTSDETDLGDIVLSEIATAISGIQVFSSFGRDRITPIAMSTVKGEELQKQSMVSEIPEKLNIVPGVYGSKEGGGIGDARLSIRGFKQENVALLLNGIPVSSVESGQVFWSNWLGLEEVTRVLQVQKGLGASKVALNSVGGTVNIITKTTEVEKGGRAGFSLTDYGNNKFNLTLNTGRLDNGFAVGFHGSRISGPGYVDATYVDAWSYFLSISKEISHKHKIVFIGLGAPQIHGQSQYKMTYNEFEEYGNKFNYGWGSYNGRINNQTENFYHNPNLNLTHYWNISEKSFLATAAYFAYGKGGGKWTESFNYAPSVFEYRNESNQIDWDAIYHNNANHRDSAMLSDGSYVKGYSKNIQSKFLADNYWVGVLSTLKHELSPQWNLTAGIHARNFKARIHEEVSDLLGGDFFIEDYAWAIEGRGDRKEIMTIGDIIRVDNTSHINYLSTFSQIEYQHKKLSAFLSGSLSGSWYQREDDFNYLIDTRSEIVPLQGFDSKTGLNYNLNDKHNLFLNAGYFSKQPYYAFVFVNFSNAVADNINNEKISSVEAGYGFKSNYFHLDVNAYYTYWKDKSFLSNENILLLDNTETRAMVKGLDALHMGIELEAKVRPVKNITLGAIVSVGNWKWKNNVMAELYNENNVLVDTVEVYADGLNVGDAPQTQLGVFASYIVLKDLILNMNWSYYDRLYADFNPALRNNPDDNSQPFMLQSFHQVDLSVGYNFMVYSKAAYLQVNCNNLFNDIHPVRGEDGAGHDRESFRGFWNFGRTFGVMLRIQL